MRLAGTQTIFSMVQFRSQLEFPIKHHHLIRASHQKTMSKPEAKKSRGCFANSVIAVVLLLLLLIVGYFVQQQIRPNVDDGKTKPVVVGNLSTTSVDETAHLPVGAVTALVSEKDVEDAEHPFDPLLKVAAACIQRVDENIIDYKATLVSQVFADGKLQPEKYLECRVRHKRTENDKNVPFSVYTLFLKPKENVGQEAIWVDGWNDGNLVAHATGLLNIKRAYLDPDGSIAMQGNRYAIREIGIRNLIVKMCETGEKDRAHGECRVTIKRKVDVNGCQCTMFQAVHPYKRDHFDFHIARIYIDDVRNIPIAYEGYLWPEKEGEAAPLIEKYYYTDIELNIGLTDEDFDPGNQNYNYPSW